jgi:hypothetical protein
MRLFSRAQYFPEKYIRAGYMGIYSSACHAKTSKYGNMPVQYIWWPDILPKDTLPKDILPNGHFGERTFWRTDSLPNGQFAEQTV